MYAHIVSPDARMMSWHIADNGPNCIGRRKAAGGSDQASRSTNIPLSLSLCMEGQCWPKLMCAGCTMFKAQVLVCPEVAAMDRSSEPAGSWCVAPIDSSGCPVVQIPGVSPDNRNGFPLSLDHLIPMIEYNLIRASVTNAAIMNLLHMLPSNETCPPLHDKMLLFPFGRTHSIPDSLQPSPLQQSTDHDYWIDLWPDANMRDNLIVATSNGLLSHGELQADLLGTVCPTIVVEGPNASRRGFESTPSTIEEERVCGVVVWSTPWCAEGYEMSEAFVRKYSWLLRGCHNLLRATNCWRATRGEDPIVVEL